MDYMIGNTLIEVEDEKEKERDARILQEYYERLRKANKGKENKE